MGVVSERKLSFAAPRRNRCDSYLFHGPKDIWALFMGEVVEQFASNLKAVRERIADAAARSGREADAVTLVAVTKYVDAETTRALVDAGATVLGESRPQHLLPKVEALSDLSVEWHMIGHLQRNKVRRVLPAVSLIHSVDSLRLLEAIDRIATEGGA